MFFPYEDFWVILWYVIAYNKAIKKIGKKKLHRLYSFLSLSYFVRKSF